MSSVVKTLFGGTDTSSQKAQIAANREAADFAREMAAQARGDVMQYVPKGNMAARQGFQSAFDLTTKTAPRMMDATRGGHIRAQEALLAGLPQMQNALMGLPVDLSGLNVSSFGAGDADIFRDAPLPNFMPGPGSQGSAMTGTTTQANRAAAQEQASKDAQFSAGLEKLWAENPDLLRQAIQQNPQAFLSGLPSFGGM
jgi:hypothetical protein